MARRHEAGKPEVTLAAGGLYTRMGLTDEADQAYAALLASTPSLAAEPDWPTQVIEAAMARAGSPWELALMAGDADRARAMATESGTDLDDLVVAAWTGDVSALDELQDLALAAPTDDLITSWAARASAMAGDAEAADRFRRIAVFDYEGSTRLGYEIRILGPSREPVEGALDATHHYGRNDYRRPTPGQLLAPGLPTIVLVDLATGGAGAG
jgi:hypothetical protein